MERGMIRRRLVARIGEVGRMNVEAFTNGLATRTGLWREMAAYRTSLRHCRLIRREEKREANCISGTRRWQGSRPKYIGNGHPETSEGEAGQVAQVKGRQTLVRMGKRQTQARWLTSRRASCS